MPTDTPAYRTAYLAGWRYAARTSDLDRADADGRSQNSAWMDGYLDRAAGRERWHLLRCADHDKCG